MSMDEEKQRKLINKAREVFGTTENCHRGGYILPNGDMLDFGNPDDKVNVGKDYRYQDHSEVWQVYERLPEIESIKEKGKCFANTFNDQWLKETATIRMNASAHYLLTGEMFQPHTPTKKQLETLEYCNCIIKPEEVILEFAKCDEDGSYNPKNIVERNRENDCVGTINDLNKKIKKWKGELNRNP